MTKLLPLAGLSVLLAAQVVHAQTLSLDLKSLIFTAAVNGAPTSLPINVTSLPTGAIVLATAVEQTDSQVTWLSVSPTGGQTPVALAVTVNPGNLNAGVYSGSIVVSVFGQSSSVTVPVNLTVSTIYVSPPTLNFQTAVGNTPPASSVTLTASAPVAYAAVAATTTGGNWLQINPSSGIVSGYTALSAILDTTIVPLLSPGTYNGTITITPTSGTALTPVVVPVTLVVTPAPAVNVSATAVNLQYQIGGSNNSTQQTLTMTTANAQGVAFLISATSETNPSGGTWVLASPPSGTITPGGAQLAIGYNAATALPVGNWKSTVSVNTPNGSPTKTDIAVTLQVSNQPLLSVPGSTLSFSYELGTPSPATQTVTVTATSGTQDYNVSVATADGAAWLVAPTTGTTPTPLSISVNPVGLAPGTYTGTVTVTGVGTGNGAQQIPVTLKVSSDPAIVTNFSAVNLPFQLGQTVSASQSIAVTSSNGVPLNFTATAATTTCGSGWLSLLGSSGTTPGQVTVGVNAQALVLGTCTGTIAIAATSAQTGASAINSPVTIPVSVTVSSGPLLVVSPATPAVFVVQAGSVAVGTHVFTLSSTDSEVLNFNVASSTTSGGSNWLQTLQSSGTTASDSNSLIISVQAGQLAPGTYSGTVTITATGPSGATVGNSPLTIPVTFLVTAGSLVLSPTSLNFRQPANGAAPAPQTVNITSTGQPLNFAASAVNSGSVNWLHVSPSGTTPGSLSVSVDGSSLQQGNYNGTVTVLSTTPNAGNSPASIAVNLQVNAGTISASPTSLTFSQVQGGPPPGAQSVTVSGTPNAINFQASVATADSGNWLKASPAVGATPSTLQVGIVSNNLTVGTYSGTLTIVGSNADGNPVTVQVTLNVLPPIGVSVAPNSLTFKVDSGSTAVQTAQVQINTAGGSAPFGISNSGGAWLTASPTSGSAPTTLTVTADPTGLTDGAYSGAIAIVSPNSVNSATVTVNLVVGMATPPSVSAVANAASYGTGSLAPGENVVIFGTGIGPSAVTLGASTNGVWDTMVGATRVLFDGIPVAIIYAFSTQTSVIAPFALAGRTTVSIVVEYEGVQSSPVAFTLTLAAPGIYTLNSQGSGPGAILNQDYSRNLPTAPAAKGSVMSVYMTGTGFTVGAVDGLLATDALQTVLPVSATVAGIPATVVYAGSSPGIINGVTQVNVQIPMNAPSGSSVPIVITVGTGDSAASTQAGVTLAVQ